MDQHELKERTKQFALRIMKLVGALPDGIVRRAIGNQLVRSGTGVGANYRAACRGRSKTEFIAKLGTVEEEADETAFWLELVHRRRVNGRATRFQPPCRSRGIGGHHGKVANHR